MSRPFKKSKKNRFDPRDILYHPVLGITLVELLIVVAFISVMALVAVAMNINTSVYKGRDSKRKQDLNKLLRVFEDYYNDKGAYPPASGGRLTEAAWGKSLLPYLSTLPSDPQGTNHQYYYETNPNRTYFVIYAVLENVKDTDITSSGCDAGCGPGMAYNFSVHSPNVILLGGQPSQDFLAGAPDPTSTPLPPTITPTPLPPTPTTVPGALGYNDTCDFPPCSCGAFPPHPPGAACIADEKCCMGQNPSDPVWYWICGQAFTPCPTISF